MFESVEDLNFILGILKRNNYNISHLSQLNFILLLYFLWTLWQKLCKMFGDKELENLTYQKMFSIKVVILIFWWIQLILTKKRSKVYFSLNAQSWNIKSWIDSNTCAIHTVQSWVISNKSPRTFDSCLSIYVIDSYIKSIK